MIGTGGTRERERRDHRIAGTADVEHFPREGRQRELLRFVPAAERDPVRTESQHDVGPELGGEGAGHRSDRFFRRLGIRPSKSARDSRQLGVM